MTSQSQQSMERTHHCGQLGIDDDGREVRLAGWVRSYRDHGGVVFIDLRDREGITQVVFDPDAAGSADLHDRARALRNEWVIAVAGKVRPRGQGKENPKLATGQIEVLCDNLAVLNTSEPVPFEPDEHHSTSEETRLKYRYIDLRRPEMAAALRMRHTIVRAMREVLDAEQFIEVETPFLTKSTPEGARDFLVPSRLHPGCFYALPQSPQLFKQILMVGGIDRYYQVVRCFRDEDLRADRQPEFTQLDLEMSFCTERDVMRITDAVLRKVCAVSGKTYPDEVPMMTYGEAMRRFGSDRPDLRFGMELVDLSDIAGQTEFGVFGGALEAGGVVHCIAVPGGGEMTRKETDALADWAKGFGAKGLAVTKVAADGQLETGIAKFIQPIAGEIIHRTGANQGDLLCFGADTAEVVQRVLGELRCKMARDRGLVPDNTFEWVWITDFPLVEWSEEHNRWDVLHHPFTSPVEEDLSKLADPATRADVRSRAYDIVCNGMEMGGGSVRIHRPDVQRQVFEAIGIAEEEAAERFSFLLDALKFGAPPHGGLALGLDRVVMTMIGGASIRDVMAFPKTQRGTCPMTDAPGPVDDAQLRELFLRSTAQAPPDGTEVQK